MTRALILTYFEQKKDFNSEISTKQFEIKLNTLILLNIYDFNIFDTKLHILNIF